MSDNAKNTHLGRNDDGLRLDIGLGLLRDSLGGSVDGDLELDLPSVDLLALNVLERLLLLLLVEKVDKSESLAPSLSGAELLDDNAGAGDLVVGEEGRESLVGDGEGEVGDEEEGLGGLSGGGSTADGSRSRLAGSTATSLGLGGLAVESGGGELGGHVVDVGGRISGLLGLAVGAGTAGGLGALQKRPEKESAPRSSSFSMACVTNLGAGLLGLDTSVDGGSSLSGGGSSLGLTGRTSSGRRGRGLGELDVDLAASDLGLVEACDSVLSVGLGGEGDETVAGGGKKGQLLCRAGGANTAAAPALLNDSSISDKAKQEKQLTQGSAVHG